MPLLSASDSDSESKRTNRIYRLRFKAGPFQKESKSTMDIRKETVDDCMAFVEERNWKQFHNPKDLALSLSLEASELLELFQWKTSEEAVEKNREKMKDELADVIVYALDFADVLGFDLNEIITEKMKKNREKYPVEKARNSSKKYDEL